jgi:oligoribonuclease (3'-5' exoribonuclease)
MKEGDGVLVGNDIASDKRFIATPLLSHEVITYDTTDSVASTRSFIRHDSNKIAEAIHGLL